MKEQEEEREEREEREEPTSIVTAAELSDDFSSLL